MIDRTQEDINQDARLSRIEHKLVILDAQLEALEVKIDELKPVIGIVERIESLVGHVLGFFEKEGKL